MMLSQRMRLSERPHTRKQGYQEDICIAEELLKGQRMKRAS